jgi:hypothetical protein
MSRRSSTRGSLRSSFLPKHFEVDDDFLLDSQRGLARHFGAESALRWHCIKCERIRKLMVENESAILKEFDIDWHFPLRKNLPLIDIDHKKLIH